MRWMNVSIERIDWSDRRFSFRSPGSCPPEKTDNETAHRGEWTEPVILCPGEKEDLWTLVDGQAQAFASRREGKESLSAFCLEGMEANPRRCLLIAYQRSLQQGALTLAEKASFVACLRKTGEFSEKEILDTWLTRLGLPASYPALERLFRLEAWPDALRREIESGDINPSVLLNLADLPAEQASPLVRFLSRYRWTHSRQKEIVRLVSDMAQIQNRSLDDICAEADDEGKKTPEGASMAQKAEIVRRYLVQQRYPHIRRAIDTYQDYARMLSLPPNIQLQEPPDFEGEIFRLQISFKSRKELEEALRKVQGIVDLPPLDAILKLT